MIFGATYVESQRRKLGDDVVDHHLSVVRNTQINTSKFHFSYPHISFSYLVLNSENKYKKYSWGSCSAYMHSKVKDWWAWRDEKWGERPGERRGGCLIEIYHYTVICVNYCAAIEQQQHEFGSRPCTHTHKRTRCASSGAVIEGVSVLVATVQVLSAGLVCVRSMTAGRPLIHTNAHTHKHAQGCDT